MDTARVPLYLAISSALYVQDATEAYKGLTEALVTTAIDNGHWEDDACPTTGVLLQAAQPTQACYADSDVAVSEYPLTEIVVYAERRPVSSQTHENGFLQHDLLLRAVLLSSHLFYAAASYEQPFDPAAEARFLPEVPVSKHANPEQPAPVKATKRDSIDTLFDSAAEMRRKARKKGGQSIGFAASRGTPQPQSPLIKAEEGEIECLDNSLPNVNVLQGRHRRPYPAIVETKPAKPPSRPSSRTGAERKRSSLSQVQTPEDSSFDYRNKQTISKTVMAGMRMHGLQQRKGGSERQIEGVLDDDEYKMVYHQTFKGAVFACRRQIDVELLRPDAVREVVDRLLAVFCGEVGQCMTFS